MMRRTVRTPEERKKRVARLRRMIVRGVFLIFVLLVTVCVILGFLAYKYKTKADELENTVAKLAMMASSKESFKDDIEEEEAQEVIEDQLPAEEVDEADYIRMWEEANANAKPQKAPTDGIRKVYITFDDGPSIYTDEILDILKEYNVKATFFVAGQGKDVFKDKLRRIVDEGHTLGMHTYSHKYKEIYKSKEAFIEDFNKIQNFVYENTSVHPTVYRFPGGSSNHVGNVPVEELVGYLDELGVEYYDWNLSGQDATGQNLTPSQIASYSTRGIEELSTAIILLHDSGDKYTTVQALPAIIETIKSLEDTVILPIDENTHPIHHGEEQ